MATFKGFNTINQAQTFSLTDFNLIKRDLLNAFMIRSGEVPGRPDLGTDIWAYLFDPNDAQTNRALDKEVRKVIGMDPRLDLKKVDITQSHNTVIIEVAVIVQPNTSVEALILNFNTEAQSLNIN